MYAVCLIGSGKKQLLSYTFLYNILHYKYSNRRPNKNQFLIWQFSVIKGNLFNLIVALTISWINLLVKAYKIRQTQSKVTLLYISDAHLSVLSITLCFFFPTLPSQDLDEWATCLSHSISCQDFLLSVCNACKLHSNCYQQWNMNIEDTG